MNALALFAAAATGMQQLSLPDVFRPRARAPFRLSPAMDAARIYCYGTAGAHSGPGCQCCDLQHRERLSHTAAALSEPDRLTGLFERDPVGPPGSDPYNAVAAGHFLDWQQLSKSFTSIGAAGSDSLNLASPGNLFRAPAGGCLPLLALGLPDARNKSITRPRLSTG